MLCGSCTPRAVDHRHNCHKFVSAQEARHGSHSARPVPNTSMLLEEDLQRCLKAAGLLLARYTARVSVRAVVTCVMLVLCRPPASRPMTIYCLGKAHSGHRGNAICRIVQEGYLPQGGGNSRQSCGTYERAFPPSRSSQRAYEGNANGDGSRWADVRSVWSTVHLSTASRLTTFRGGKTHLLSLSVRDAFPNWEKTQPISELDFPVRYGGRSW